MTPVLKKHVGWTLQLESGRGRDVPEYPDGNLGYPQDKSEQPLVYVQCQTTVSDRTDTRFGPGVIYHDVIS